MHACKIIFEHGQNKHVMIDDAASLVSYCILVVTCEIRLICKYQPLKPNLTID